MRIFGKHSGGMGFIVAVLYSVRDILSYSPFSPLSPLTNNLTLSALSGVDIALWDLKGKNLKVPVYELLGGKVRNEVQVYCWIGGDRPSDVESAA